MTYTLRMAPDNAGFDRSAAVARSLLGWGVVAGPFYVVVGMVLALTRPDFDLTRHALSLLMLGEHGWMQQADAALSALMVLAAAYGVLRTIRSGRGLAIGVLTATYGICLGLSAVFLPAPMDGFPSDQTDAAAPAGGILHLVVGALGFVALAAAAFAYARWASSNRDSRSTKLGTWCGSIILVGFIAGSALAQMPIGIAALWVSVLTGWLWLALASAHLYTVAPHPVISERREPPAVQ